MSISFLGFSSFHHFLIFGGLFFQIIKSQEENEFLIPSEPIEQSNGAEIGQEFAAFRGILLSPSAERPYKLLQGELIYSVEFGWLFKEYTKSPFPNMHFSVKTNKFGGFLAKIPAKYKAENENLRLKFRHPNQKVYIECFINCNFDVKNTYGCKIGEKHQILLKNTDLFELEDELSKFKDRKNNPHLIVWDKFDEILLKIKRIEEEQKRESEKNGGGFDKMKKEFGKIAPKIDEVINLINRKFNYFEEHLKSKKTFGWKSD